MNRSVLLVLLVSPAVFAEDPFACVDPDVANAFLGQWQRDLPSYSTSIPDDFVNFDVPAAMSLVGSEVGAGFATVVFKTSLGVEDAMSAAAATMADAGWAEKPDEFSMARHGFQAVQRSAPAVFCHENQPGAVSVTAEEKTGKTLVSLVQHAEAVSRTCDEPARRQAMEDPIKLMARLPALRLPEGTTAANQGSGGSNDEVNTAVEVSGGLGQSDLVSYLGDQIRDQGWTYEAGWSGALSSGTVWTMDTRDDGALIGMLHAYGGVAGPVRIRFSIYPADSAENAHTGRWSSTAIQSN